MSSQDALNQANAQMESVHEMVAALECDYDRLEELKESKTPYAANWSMIGCLPDNEAMLCDTEEEARDAIIEELQGRAEVEEESSEYVPEEEKEEFLTRAKAYNDAAKHLEESEEDSIVVNGYHFWVTEAEYEGLTEEEYKELQDLEDDADDCESHEDAERRIMEDALSVEVRSDWESLGNPLEPTEFRIVLCTGGPHVEIRGELDNGEPVRAWLAYQDWFTGLTERVNDSGDQDALLTYARCFYFGE